ncbi:DgyrCDS8567 [Dimorphilus gyrociliatus]|uniref:DgyrCDS8567 n=1 Tax=Dimorphilus gyrociliatus TaxID=2664684 RepID=A0A7I8VUK4_9ANNE|nr:DgyrCDS8567 [Dimorphilus gyrociliatus]
MVKIFVGNIPDDLYGNEIRELFESFGTVEEATRLSKFAFVHMPNKEEADEALKGLDKYHIRGYNINVEISTSTAGEKGGPRNKSDRSAFSGNRGGGSDRGGMMRRGGPPNRGGFNRGTPDRFHPYGFSNPYVDSGRSEYERRDDFDGPQQEPNWDPYSRPPPDAYKRPQEALGSTAPQPTAGNAFNSTSF